MEEVVSLGGVCETRGENMFQLQSSLTNCVRPLSGGKERRSGYDEKGVQGEGLLGSLRYPV